MRNFLTTNTGAPITDNQNSLTAGQNGPTLLQDYQLIEKIAHFDRERIPERVVHARGAGAFGQFEAYGTVGDRPISAYTKAHFLQEKGRQTDLFVRFSTVIHPAGSPETLRDPRGFAVKFYTEEGNYDLVGNNLPIFFIRDAMKFPDMIHSLKPAPQSNTQDPNRAWDFFSLSPESTHMLTWVYSDLGIPANYRQMFGFGVHTFKWVNAAGKAFLVKYHWIPEQGVRCLIGEEIAQVQGKDHSHATRDLYDSIERGDYPAWELKVQIIDPAEPLELDFDPEDPTKTWPEEQFPLYPIGRMVLNRNPRNYFAEVEQSAFSPAVVVPGIEPSNDKLLQGRLFSYPDTQRYRLGANYLQIPVNCPYAPVRNNQRDGAMTMTANPSYVDFEPSSLEGALVEAEVTTAEESPALVGNQVRLKIAKTNDFGQAGARYRSLSPDEQSRLVDNLVSELGSTQRPIQERAICNFARADMRLGLALAERLGIEAPNTHG